MNTTEVVSKESIERLVDAGCSPEEISDNMNLPLDKVLGFIKEIKGEEKVSYAEQVEEANSIIDESVEDMLLRKEKTRGKSLMESCVDNLIDIMDDPEASSQSRVSSIKAMSEIVLAAKEKQNVTYEDVTIRLRRAKELAALPVQGGGVITDVSTPGS